MGKTLLLTAIFFLLLGLLLFSCKKDTISAEATIVDQGSPASDGCGWFIRINGVIYGATNLKQEYLVDQLKVMISYKLTDQKTRCQGYVPANTPNTIPVIYITSIRRL